MLLKDVTQPILDNLVAQRDDALARIAASDAVLAQAKADAATALKAAQDKAAADAATATAAEAALQAQLATANATIATLQALLPATTTPPDPTTARKITYTLDPQTFALAVPAICALYGYVPGGSMTEEQFATLQVQLFVGQAIAKAHVGQATAAADAQHAAAVKLANDQAAASLAGAQVTATVE